MSLSKESTQSSETIETESRQRRRLIGTGDRRSGNSTGNNAGEGIQQDDPNPAFLFVRRLGSCSNTLNFPTLYLIGVVSESGKIYRVEVEEESSDRFWTDTFDKILKLGVENLPSIIGSNTPAIAHAAERTWPGVRVYMDLVCLQREVFTYIDRRHWFEFSSDLGAVHRAANRSEARTSFESFSARWLTTYREAVELVASEWVGLAAYGELSEVERRTFSAVGLVDAVSNLVDRGTDDLSTSNRQFAADVSRSHLLGRNWMVSWKLKSKRRNMRRLQFLNDSQASCDRMHKNAMIGDGQWS
nr:transposase [Rhodococcus sp. (in: high G+C Gram-positive bacteria)]